MDINAATQEQILEELTNIDNFLQITCSEDIEEVTARGSDLAVYLSRSSKLLADAKYWLNRKQKDEVFDTLRQTAKQSGATSKAVNKIIDSLCAEQRYLVDYADRINATITHQLDWCRTLISKAKVEMQIAPMQKDNNRPVQF